MSHSPRPFVSLAFWGSVCLAFGSAGCSDPEVGSVRAKDESEKKPIVSKTEGRFKENVPSKPVRGTPKGGSRDEGIESR